MFLSVDSIKVKSNDFRIFNTHDKSYCYFFNILIYFLIPSFKLIYFSLHFLLLIHAIHFLCIVFHLHYLRISNSCMIIYMNRKMRSEMCISQIWHFNMFD